MKRSKCQNTEKRKDKQSPKVLKGVGIAWICVGYVYMTYRYAANVVEYPAKVVTD
jgi:Na+-transporting NADH:ubiquinone oxidoreductase subunit NqrE